MIAPLKNETWDVGKAPQVVHLTSSEWVYKIKYGSMKRSKAKLVAKVFSQKYGLSSFGG